MATKGEPHLRQRTTNTLLFCLFFLSELALAQHIAIARDENHNIITYIQPEDCAALQETPDQTHQ